MMQRDEPSPDARSGETSATMRQDGPSDTTAAKATAPPAGRGGPRSPLFAVQARAWLPHAVLAMLIGLEVAAFGVLHRTMSDLEALLESGTPRERVYALHVLANRGQPPRFSRRDLAEWFETQPPLVAELLMTHNFARFAGPRIRQRYIDEQADAADAARAEFWFQRQVSQRDWITLEELGDFLKRTR